MTDFLLKYLPQSISARTLYLVKQSSTRRSMMEKLPTDEQALPKVAIDVFNVVQNEKQKSGSEQEWYVDIARDIKEANPLIFEVMLRFSQKAMEAEDSGRCHDLVHKAVLLTYRLLQTQADVQQLTNEFLIEEIDTGDDKDDTR